MITVGAFEAKTHLPKLLERVRRGEEITITRRGVPVAVLVPAENLAKETKDDLKQAVAEMKAFGQGRSLPAGVTVRDLIEEGRRF